MFFFISSCLPAALHFYFILFIFFAQSCRKVPLDTLAAELGGFARIQRIWVTVLEERVLTPFFCCFIILHHKLRHRRLSRRRA